MNYLIKVKGEAVVITQEEMEKIKVGQNEGVDMVYLRDETMGINPKRVDMFKETNQNTEYEEKTARENAIVDSSKLLAERKNSKSQEFLKKVHFDYYKKKGWNHDNPNCVCKSWVME